jgi:hypothetical protein
LFPFFNDQFNIFFFELTVAAGRLNATRRRLSRQLASAFCRHRYIALCGIEAAGASRD